MWMKNIDTQDQEQGDVARYCVMKEIRQGGGGVDVGAWEVVSFIPVYI